MDILMTTMLLNLFSLTGKNNVCSTLMEKLLMEEILAEDIFMILQNFKIVKNFSDVPITKVNSAKFSKTI